MAPMIWTEFVALLMCCFLRQSTGSAIVFESSPTEIKDGLTGTITLRCSLNDTAASANLIGRRDVTQTADNMAEVSSIIVMKGGVDVASVSHSHGARVIGVAPSLTVAGDLTGSAGEKGFLQLTYKVPSTPQSGEFVCEVNAISDNGHAKIFSTSLEVNISEPTVPDLIRYIRELEDRNNQIQSGVLKRLESLEHVESGLVYCGASSGWKRSDPFNWHESYVITNGQTKDITVKFKQPYTTAPVVKIGVIEVDAEHSTTIRYSGGLVSVDSQGFTIRCATWLNSKMYQLGFSWMSVSN